MAGRRFVFSMPCESCVWNSKPRCGRNFCMLPRCVQTEAAQKRAQLRSTKTVWNGSVGWAQESRRAEPYGKIAARG